VRSDVSLGIGDDAALLDVPAEHQLVTTTDVLIADVHFHSSATPHSIGHKALAVNLSDLAAMGATPAWATLGMIIPDIDERWLEKFCDGFFYLAKLYDIDLVGGDTARGPLMVAIQLMGWVPRGAALKRSGARSGDHIYITGTLGDAGLALMHLKGLRDLLPDQAATVRQRLDYPCPRVELGIQLRSLASAAIDVSDGFVADLRHLLRCSAVGAEIYLDELPISKVYQSLYGEIGWEPALTSGDDYELCFTAAPDRDDEISTLTELFDIPITRVGTVTIGSDIVFFDREGQQHSPKHTGYDHFGV